MKIGWAVMAACVLLAGCGHKRERVAAVSAAPAAMDWHAMATDADRDRLRHWRDAWMAALPRAKAAGKGAALAADGALFNPDRALPDAALPPGDYRCRVYKLGANGTAMAEFTAYPAARCRVDDEGEALSLRKVDGAQRPIGLIVRDTPARSVFLGTMVLSDEGRALDYGRDADRDMIGYVERIGPKRWRLVLPYPRFESLLDVVELAPAGS